MEKIAPLFIESQIVARNNVLPPLHVPVSIIISGLTS